ncbi:MAG: ABC transporter permease [Nitrososphaeraceae archaeon]
MDIKEIIVLSFDALKERKMKSILTIVMVMVGSSLMVAVGGISAGFSDFFNKQISNLAANIIFINPAQVEQGGGGGPATGPPPTAKITLNAAVESRLGSLPFVEDVIPSYQAQVTLQSQGDSKEYRVFSMAPEKLTVLSPTLEFVEGSRVRQNDPSAIIISNDLANPPGESTPFLSLGQTVKATYSSVDVTTGKRELESKSFIVRGIIKETGNPNIDNSAIINTQVGNALFHKSGKFDALIVVARAGSYVDAIEQEIRKLYGNDIGITTVKAIIGTVQEFTSGISAFLLSIAIVSLIVGAVGIITTLYTSVIERTREIGTMKAIGAKSRHILALFLSEALIVGIFGATFGLLGGIVGAYILSAGLTGNGSGANSQQIIPIFLAADMARVWLISTGLSILAGLFPALKASRLLPVAALKRE